MTSRVVITGGEGFLGWHVRVVARALRLPDPVLIGRDNLAEPDRLASLLNGADRVLHLAGVNRGTPDQVSAGNLDLARALADGLRRCTTPPKSVAFANSIQAGNGTPYGESKAHAAALLSEATQWSGSSFADIRLPNLFGEHGRPHYNSVIATFCRVLADGGNPHVEQDRELELMHATDAATTLLAVDLVGPPRAPEEPVLRSVSQLAEQLRRFATTYRIGEIPELINRFDIRLFNTYRSHCFPGDLPLRLPRHTDDRGDLVEAVKVHGGGGQTFCSGTKPDVTRGDHFHLAKVERFLVVRGEAEIRLRRVLHDDVIRFRVSGAEPSIVDMPTMWVHSITNVGESELVTLFWANDLFDPVQPDTYQEKVL